MFVIMQALILAAMVVVAVSIMVVCKVYFSSTELTSGYLGVYIVIVALLYVFPIWFLVAMPLNLIIYWKQFKNKERYGIRVSVLLNGTAMLDILSNRFT